MIRKFTPLPNGLGRMEFKAQDGTELQEFVRSLIVPATHELKVKYDGQLSFTLEPVIRPEFAKQAAEIEAAGAAKGPEPVKELTDLEKMTVPQLTRMAVELGLDPKTDIRKADLVALIVAKQKEHATPDEGGDGDGEE